MEPISVALAVFLAPYLKKAGETVAEKTVEALFDSRRDLAEKFTGLFKNEIITLGLNEATSPAEITKQLEARPEVKQEVANKIANNQFLIAELVEAFQRMPGGEFAGITINAKNIGAVFNNVNAPINLNNKFS